MKIAVIRCHVVTLGYEDSNPFSLCKWMSDIGKEGYTEILEREFDMYVLTPQNRELLGDINLEELPPDVLFVNEYKDVYTKKWLDEQYSITDLEELEEVIVVAPISQLVSLGDGDIEVTTV